MPRRLIAALGLSLALAVAAAAQPAPDYQAWDAEARAAETLLEDDAASAARLTTLRDTLVDRRDAFQAAQDVNGPRITTLREQLEALGAPPAEGEAEDEAVADRRAALNAQLAEAQAPRLKAVEAFSRADAIILQIDETLRARQGAALATVSPSPLNPAHWPVALSEAGRIGAAMAGEIAGRFAARDAADLRARLPAVAGYVLFAVLALTIGRHWVDRLPRRLSHHASRHSRAVLAFVVSLAQITLPVLGLLLMMRALAATGLFGAWTRPVLVAVPLAGTVFFAGRWIARQVFPTHAIAYDTLTVPEPVRGQARRISIALAAVTALHVLLIATALTDPRDLLAQTDPDRVPEAMAPAASAVWHFLFLVVAAGLLYRLGNVLRRLPRWDAGDPTRYRARILGWMGQAARLVALAAPLAAAAGYVAAANALLWPFAMTLALAATVILLQDFIGDLFDMLSGGREGAREGLWPLLIGLGLVIAALPLLVLIWGARTADLVEGWARLRRGITLGGITLSPGAILTSILVFAALLALTRFVQGLFRTSILPKTRIAAGGQTALVSGIGYVGIMLAVIIGIVSAGINLSSLAIVAGALSVGIGFGLQNVVSNFVSGIILLIERPINVGDWIQAGGQEGIVRRISVRSTQVETFDRTTVIVPNADLVTQPVTNWTRHGTLGRMIVPVGVAYGTDTRRVDAILRGVIDEQAGHMTGEPLVLFAGFGNDSLDFEIRAILTDVNARLGIASEVRHRIAERFAEEGIEIPFPQRDLWLRNPEALAPRGRGAAAAPPQPAKPSPAGDGGAATLRAAASQAPPPAPPEEVEPPPRGASPGRLAQGGADDGDGAGQSDR